MKRRIISLNSSTEFYLPDECWELIIKFTLNDGDRYLESLSVVSKRFLSITNRVKNSLTLNCNPPRPYLRKLFQRFTNFNTLDLTRFIGDLDTLLYQISRLPFNNFNLKSLKISNQSKKIPENGLLAFSKKITTLTSLTVSNNYYLRNKDLVFISDCFPLLEELDLSYTNHSSNIIDVGVKAMSMKLPKLRKINLSGYKNMHNSSLFHLCKNCKFLEEIIMLNWSSITYYGIASAIRERPGLTSLSFICGERPGLMSYENISSQFIDSIVSLKGLTCLNLSYSFVTDEILSSIAEKGLPLRRLVLNDCSKYSYGGIFSLLSKCQRIQHLDLQNARFLRDHYVVELSSFLVDLVSINISHCKKLTELALFALARNYPSLSEIKMEHTNIGKISVENYNSMMNLVVNLQLKSLRLAHNSYLEDKNIIMFASICPNLELLDLSFCYKISEGIGDVLRCCKIRHLNLAYCSGLTLLKINIEVSMLEVLNLYDSNIDDRSLYSISESCFGLLQFDLGRCYDVTEKGVRVVVEKCTKLREINLLHCHKLGANVVNWMVSTRPSLRKIIAPPSLHCGGIKRKFFLRRGCLVC